MFYDLSDIASSLSKRGWSNANLETVTLNNIIIDGDLNPHICYGSSTWSTFTLP